uniref:Uncharacterized protein n=1 Tax=Oryza sativa subsp. japonica TaxID=39947 RepID=Q656C5_ORYSJ|nr:hypothetical protein [Oryza sativa Japonica Group]
MALDLPRRVRHLDPLPCKPSLPLSRAKISSPLDTNPPKKSPSTILPAPKIRGVESRPPGGFVNLINAPSNHMHHVAEGSPSQPINVENGDVARTEKRLSWTNDEDLRLEWPNLQQHYPKKPS